MGRLAVAAGMERVSGLRWKLRGWLRLVLAVAIGSARGLVERGGVRAGVYVRESPSAAEIAANYTRGWVLFGVDVPGVGGLEWRRFPKRAVITRETARVPKRLRSIQRRQDLVVRYDEDFEAIVGHCREGRSGWLTDQAVDAYRSLMGLGFSRHRRPYQTAAPGPSCHIVVSRVRARRLSLRSREEGIAPIWGPAVSPALAVHVSRAVSATASVVITGRRGAQG